MQNAPATHSAGEEIVPNPFGGPPPTFSGFFYIGWYCGNCEPHVYTGCNCGWRSSPSEVLDEQSLEVWESLNWATHIALDVFSYRAGCRGTDGMAGIFWLCNGNFPFR